MLGFHANRRILALAAAFFFVTTAYFCVTRLSSVNLQPLAVSPPARHAPSASLAVATNVVEQQTVSTAVPTQAPLSDVVDEDTSTEKGGDTSENTPSEEEEEEEDKEEEDTPSEETSSKDTPPEEEDEDEDEDDEDDEEEEEFPLHSALPPHLTPSPHNARRLIIIGDIHGMLPPLLRLLRKVHHAPATDHIISVGDIISKGPHPSLVLSHLISLNASAVRGNHEHALLTSASSSSSSSSSSPASGITTEQRAWLAKTPAVLSVEGLRMHVVHAGLVPGVRVGEQDAWAVMNMRSLAYPDENSSSESDSQLEDEHDGLDEAGWVPLDTREGERWTKAWNRRQRLLPRADRWTVIYGHDAKRGLREERYTIGLDSGCVRGGHLSALVVQGRPGGWKGTVEQVKCHDD